MEHFEKLAQQQAINDKIKEYDQTIQYKLEAVEEAEELNYFDLKNAKQEGKKAVLFLKLRYQRMLAEQYYELYILARQCNELKKENNMIDRYPHDVEQYEKHYNNHTANVKKLERRLTNA